MVINHSVIEKALNDRREALINQQQSDGTWRFCCEGPVMTDAYMIILLRTLDSPEEDLITKLADRLLSQQEKDGTWNVYPNETTGNLSATTEAYTALLYSGHVNGSEAKMKKAAAFIRSSGGLKKTGLLTRSFFAMNGLYPWPKWPLDPTLIIYLPLFFPINFFEFSSYARAHFAPVMTAYQHRYKKKSRWTPDLDHLSMRDHNPHDPYWPELQTVFKDMRSPLSAILQTVYKWKQVPNQLANFPERWLENYMLERIEPDGTLLSYASATFFMVYALMALGYDSTSQIIERAVNGIKQKKWSFDDSVHIQNSPSTIWDTGLAAYALLEAGVQPENRSIQRASRYLAKKQHEKYGDWIIHNPKPAPGGWGFSPSNTIHPDNDDTQVALRTIQLDPNNKTAFQRGLRWLITMQNTDGGWASFEKNTDNYLFSLLPIKHIEAALIDPSIADITGRTLQLLGDHVGLSINHGQVAGASQWLRNRQESDGSWYGRWGVCYIYGTWAALTGMASVGLTSSDPRIQKAIKWLTSIQNEDGGWGESCESDTKKHYIPLGKSTPTQTAWALDALIAVSDQPTESIYRGIEFLIKPENQSADYPMGVGLPGAFYIHYHSYDHIFPLLTLAHFINKYNHH